MDSGEIYELCRNVSMLHVAVRDLSERMEELGDKVEELLDKLEDDEER